MFRPLTRSHRRAPRRGTVIVITVFALITILMVLGLAFMMYAAKEKAVAQAYKEAASTSGRLVPDPTNTANQFFSALIYDVPDDGSLFNAMRGHSIARAMYGSRSDYTNPAAPWGGSTVPWAGVGTFHEPTVLGATPLGDRALQVNHTLVMLGGTPYLIDPEWTANRSVTAAGVPPFASSLTNRSYIGKHAGYTYPDLKNFFLAARDPATGEVLVPSFFRDWLFRHPSQPAGQSALHPSNPNWGIPITGIGNPEADAALRILRPRPLEHPSFPRVPPNPDGTFTGDVQNLPGQVGVQRMDSIWMHLGLPQITLPDGRVVQPMVAPLILPLDGNFDLSMHGNRLGASSAHYSYGGYAPWEINLGYGMANEADRQAIMANRIASRTASFDFFTTNQLMPDYSSVAWNGQPPTAAGPVTFVLPSGNSLRGVPSSGDAAFVPPFGSFQNDNTALIPNHPGGYDLNEFLALSDANPNSPIFPYTDLKRLSLRYAFTPDWYFQAAVSRPSVAQTTFFGTPGTFPYVPTPNANTASSYRLDPAHTRRLLFSPKNRGLDRITAAPNFVRSDQTTALQLNFPVNGVSIKPGALIAGTTTYPSPQPLGPVTDFAAANQWVNIQAALGSVNLNRPLADYRDLTAGTNQPIPQPLSATNVSNAALADADRQQFAKDIFARLIVALGAAGQVSFDQTLGVVINLPDPNTLLLAGVTYTQAHYDALRYLAQLAVNIVDYIDNDDVSTVFVWNPSGAGPTTDLSSAQVGNRAVFGVEKPRLVINEVYSEITNAPTDPVNDPTVPPAPLPAGALAHVRFWAELLNPTNPPHNPTAPGAQGIFGTGAVNLSAYQIQIARSVRTTITPAAGQTGDLAGPITNPLHAKFQANTTGMFDPSVGPPDATFTFPQGAGGVSVSPNNGQYIPPAASLPANGFVLVGPPTAAKNPPSKEFNPPNGAAAAATVWANAVIATNQPGPATTSTSMGYTFTMPAAATLESTEFKRHVVLLRRSVNPYLPPNDPQAPTFNAGSPINPYVTVDVMDYVPSFDAVHRDAGKPTDRGDTTTNAASGYDPVTSRFSVGKVQPLAGFSSATVAAGVSKYNTYSFNAATAPAQNSMVLNQTATPTLPPGPPNPNEPMNTFGRHNGKNPAQPGASTIAVAPPATPGPALISDTIMLPFDWQPHMDRPLETLGDVFTVRDCKPHRLTAEFVVNNTAAAATTPGLVYDSSYARWRFHAEGLARGLEYLTVKSPDIRVAHGGRTAGKVNVNVMQDQRVAQGVWDPQPNNLFDPTSTYVNTTVWGQWMNSRTPLQQRLGADGTTVFQVPVPNQRFVAGVASPASSLTDMQTGSDRPFLSFGAPASVAGSFAYTTGSGTEDTILRRNVTGPTPGLPLLYQTAQTNAYTQTEPVRKVLNNVTTVSHSFVVYLTIGYFEVTNPPAPAGWPAGVQSPPQFGAEVYDKIPGDMRQKYMAVIDMSNMALKPVFDPTTDPEPTNPHALGQPFFSTLTATARPTGGTGVLSITFTRFDPTVPAIFGKTDGIEGGGAGVNSQLVLGYGADTQVVTVQSIGPAAGQITVTGMTRTAWAGTCVSTVRPGYAGPQPAFDAFDPINSARYKPVIPYVERLR